MSNKMPNNIDEITKILDLLDEQIAYLEQNESNMTWESYDKAYTELLDYQTELVQRQAEYSSELFEGYSDQLKPSGLGQKEPSASRQNQASLTIRKGATTCHQVISCSAFIKN